MHHKEERGVSEALKQCASLAAEIFPWEVGGKKKVVCCCQAEQMKLHSNLKSDTLCCCSAGCISEGLRKAPHCTWLHILIYRWMNFSQLWNLRRWCILWLSRYIYFVSKTCYMELHGVKVTDLIELPLESALSRMWVSFFLFALGKRVLKLRQDTKGSTSTWAATWILISPVLRYVERWCLATRAGWQVTKWLLRQQSLE